MKRIGTNQEMAQAKNRELILRILQHKGICTRVELSRQSKMKQATITNIINDFISWGIVEETGSMVGYNGRRSIGIRISDQRYRVIGLRITRKFFIIGVFSLDGKIIDDEIKEHYDNTDPEHILEKACAIINEIIIRDAGRRYTWPWGLPCQGPIIRTSERLQ